MYLQINELKLNNIRCFSKFKVGFREGVNVITGPNGSGKSTIITSIGFGLFGANYLTGMNLNIDDLIKRGQSSGKIELNFSTHEGTYRSVHHISHSGSNGWRIYQKGIRTPLAETITDSRNVVHSLLGEGVDHYTFKTALCSRQGELTKLLDDTASKRSDQIRKILGLDNFDRTADVMGKYIKKLSSEREQLEREMTILSENKLDKDTIENEILNNKDKITQLQKQKSALIDELEQNQTQVDKLSQLNERINLLKENTEQRKNELNEINQKMEEHQLKLDSYRSKLSIKEINQDGMNQRLQASNEKLNQINLEIQQLQQKVNEYRKRNKKIKTKTQDLNQHKTRLDNEQSKLNNLLEKNTVEKREQKKNSLELKLSNYKEKRTILKSQIQNLENSKSNLNERQKAIKDTIQNIQSEFTEQFGRELTEIDDIYQDKNKEYERIETAKEKLENFHNKSQEDFGKYRANINNIQQTLNLLRETSTHHDCPVCQRSLENLDSESLIEYHESKLHDERLELDRTKKILEKQQQNITRMNNLLSSIDEMKNSLQRYHDKNEQIRRDKSELQKIKSQLDEINPQLADLKQEYTIINKTDDDMLKDKIKELHEELTEIQQLKNNIKLVKQKISSITEQITELKNEQKGINEDKLSKDIDTLNKQKSDLTTRINLISDQILPQLREYEKLKDQYKSMKQLNENEIEQLSTLEEQFDQEKYSKLKDDLNEMRKNYGSIITEIEKLGEHIETLDKQLEEANKQEQKLDQYTTSIKNLEQLEPISKKFKSILSEAPELLISKTSEQISSFMTNMIKRLLPDQGFETIVFQNDGDVHLYNGTRKVDKTTLSGGEKTVLALALRLALADYVAPLQFLTLDEPTNHLDSRRIEEFMEIIDREQLFSQSKGQLLLVTHREDFDRNAQESIRLIINEGIRQQQND